MATKKVSLDDKNRSLQVINVQQRENLHKRYRAQLPLWHHSFVGYLSSIPLVALGLAGVLLGRNLLPHFYFPSVTMVIPVVVIALFWGVGPALFTVLLGTLALDYFYIPPVGIVTFNSLGGLLQLSPFILSGVIIAIITGQRETARLRALFAEQIANERAGELEQVNRELEEANRLKDQFLSMASHELKTPISAIRGQAQYGLLRLKKKAEIASEEDNIRGILEKVDEQTFRLAALVDDLLDLSSIRAGRIELRVKGCDITALCRSVVEDQRTLSGRTIELAIPESPCMIEGDSDRLNQVVTNLVGNALKYSPGDCPVSVNVQQRDDTVLIGVRDEGAGIAQDQQARIFETFYRTPTVRTSGKRGWGLGLAICKDIVERHDGRIWCESEPGKGSTFYVELPVHPSRT